MTSSSILLADDHALVRAGIKTLIDQIAGFSVVGEASNNEQALQLLAQSIPDILVTDISMGADSGLELLRTSKDHYPETAVVILSMHASEELVSEALQLGASGYLLKEAAPGELEIALRAVSRKDTYLSPAVSKKVIERFVRSSAPDDHILQALTPRQLQILQLIGRRKTTKEIAFELDLSEKTIAAHRAQIMERTGVRDVVGLVFFAIKYGLVKDPG